MFSSLPLSNEKTVNFVILCSSAPSVVHGYTTANCYDEATFFDSVV